MGHFEVIKRTGERIQLQTREPFCAIKSAVQNTSLMGDDSVQLSIVSSELLTLEKGDKIIVFGEEYTIRTPVVREMLSDTHYTYEATFYGVMFELMKSLYRDTDANGKSTKSTFNLTYSLKDFIKVLIYNVNRDYPGLWKFDESTCPDTEPQTIHFSRQNCLQVLQSLCSKEHFNIDFRISQSAGVRTIYIGKFGDIVTPPGGNNYFEWGKGGGLYSLKENKIDDKAIKTRLWVEGGTTNIRSGYRDYSERLQLPYPKRLNKREHKLSDGTVIQAGSEMIGIDDDSKRYFEDIALSNKIGSDEDSEEYDHIYPTRTGIVTALADDDINSFVDNTMDFDLCESDDNGTKFLLPNINAKINFISGKLAGQQFDIAADGGYIHTDKKFKIIPYTDERGLTIPTKDNEAFRISVGDKYKITDINLPDSYVDNAEEDLWYAGYDDFITRKQARAQYQLLFDKKYFIDSLPVDSDTTIFNVGDYVPVRDTRFGIEKNIRIQKVSRNLLEEHDYALTLSDITTISIVDQTVIETIKHEQIIRTHKFQDIYRARRSWRTTEDLRNLVYDTDGYFDAGNIRPNSIDTNMLTVGSKSQQFVLIDVILEPNANGLANFFRASSGSLAHLTIDDTLIKQWNINGAEFTMTDPGGYYLFAKCSKSGNNAVWHLTQEQLKFDSTEDQNNYYFLVGIVSTLREDDNFRDFVTTYGFTRINGNTITTGRIVSTDGGTYYDLNNNAFRIGNNINSLEYNVDGKGELILKGIFVQSAGGKKNRVGIYVGRWNDAYEYYSGEIVEYQGSSYICTKDCAAGTLPTNTEYWDVLATKGDAGQTGYIHVKYATLPNGSDMTDVPTNAVYIGIYNSLDPIAPTDPNKYKWTKIKGSNGLPGNDGTSSYLHIKYSNDGGQTFTSNNGEDAGDYIGVYSDDDVVDSIYPSYYTWTKIKGENGKDGKTGSSLVLRGTWNATENYYYNEIQRDVVRHNGVYYMMANLSQGNNGGTPGVPNSNWIRFGTNLESAYIEMLMFANGTAQNLTVRNLQTAPTGARIEAHDDSLTVFNSSNEPRLKIISSSVGGANEASGSSEYATLSSAVLQATNNARSITRTASIQSAGYGSLTLSAFTVSVSEDSIGSNPSLPAMAMAEIVFSVSKNGQIIYSNTYYNNKQQAQQTMAVTPGRYDLMITLSVQAENSTISASCTEIQAAISIISNTMTIGTDGMKFIRSTNERFYFGKDGFYCRSGNFLAMLSGKDNSPFGTSAKFGYTENGSDEIKYGLHTWLGGGTLKGINSGSGGSGSVSWNSITDRPTKLSQFINDVGADSGGFSFAGHFRDFNSTGVQMESEDKKGFVQVDNNVACFGFRTQQGWCGFRVGSDSVITVVKNGVEIYRF